MSIRAVATAGILLLLAGCGAKEVKDVKESIWPQAPGAPAAPVVPDYSLHFKNVEVDDVAHITDIRTEETGGELTDPTGKATTDKRVISTETLEYTETILEKDPNGQPVRVRREYTRADRQMAGKPKALALEGKTVLIEKKLRAWQFRYEAGKDVAANDALLLRRDFHPNMQTPDERLKGLLPSKRVKCGETWEPDAEFMAREREKARMLGRDPAKVVGRCKLERVYTQDGHQFGVIEFRFEFPTYLAGRDDGSRVIQTTTLDGCIDGTSATLSSTTEQRMNLGTQTGANNARMTMFNQTTAKHSRTMAAPP